MKKESGFALLLTVLVLLLAFIMLFGSIILTKTRGKQVVHKRNRTLSFELAEAGINRMFYDMNQAYPPANITSTEPFGAGLGTFEVQFFPAVFPSQAYVVSKGTYKGLSRKIRVEIRGDITEAFNKHAVYAPDIEMRGTVVGNMNYVSGGTDIISNPTNKNSQIIVASSDFSIPVPDFNTYESSAVSTYTDNNDGILDPGEGDDSTGGGVSAVYNPLTDTYLFANTTINTSTVVYGNVELDNVTLNAYLIAEKDIKVRGLTATDSLVSRANITFESPASVCSPPLNEPALVAGVNVTVAGAVHQINGLVYAGNDIRILDGSTVSGMLVAGSYAELSTSGSLTYNPRDYKSKTPVVNGFNGGKRIYLPVLSSWREVR